MATLTTNYSLIKPGVADPNDQDLWGGMLNTDLDSIDGLLKTATDMASRQITASGSALVSDRNGIILADATTSTVTITLPAVATAQSGFLISIKKIDGSTNAVIVDGYGSEEIDGALSLTIPYQNNAVTLVCDGTEWRSVSAKYNSPGVQIGNLVQLEDLGGVPALPAVSGENLTGIGKGVVGRAYAERTSSIVVTGNFPQDNTIPQSNEGTEILTVSYTVSDITNKIRVSAVIPTYSAAASTNSFALFSSDSSDAIQAVFTLNSSGAGTSVATMQVEFNAASTGSNTFSIRAGAQSSVAVPGIPNLYGGAQKATIIVEELSS